VQFDHGPLGGGTDFVRPIKLIKASDPSELKQAFGAMQDAHAQGHWLAGYATYELGYALCRKLNGLLPDHRSLPLLHFGVFERPWPARKMSATQTGQLETPTPVWDFKRYAAAFKVAHDYISAGDIYQVNLTFPLTSRFSGSVDGVYSRLREKQPVPYGALVKLGDTALLSRSPELFFALTSDGEMTARPMKGTAPRGQTDAEDDALRQGLRVSDKNRAENLMIVDLLRNDMSRISEIGSVRVPKLFAIERYATLHQMTSTITSNIRRGTTFENLFTALFPCGSITGAPKIRAMEILAELEAVPRNAYCGSIGWIAPDGSMEFNVAIRTLMCQKSGATTLNVGGGVVFDSSAKDEYAEAILKSQFAVLD